MEKFLYKVEFYVSNPFEDYGMYRLVRLADNAILCAYTSIDAMRKELDERDINDTTYFE